MGLQMMGYTQKDVDDNLPVTKFVAPEEIGKVSERLKLLFQGETLQGEEYIAVRKSGNTFPVMLYSYPIFEGEKVVGVRGVAFDLSQTQADRKTVTGNPNPPRDHPQCLTRYYFQV